MYRKILLAGTTAAVIVGAGGTALAVSGSDTTSGSASTSTSAHAKHAGKNGKHGKHGRGGMRVLRRLSHGEFVTKGKDGKFVTHDLIRGTVTSVSATSITVQAADKKSETFTIGKTTKVLQRTVVKKTSAQKKAAQKKTAAQKKAQRAAHKPTKSSIAKVATGDQVLVNGTGTSTLTAKRVLDLKS